MANDEMVAEIADMYSKMSLLELLAEENMMTAFLYSRAPSAERKRLQQILHSEIERKLR